MPEPEKVDRTTAITVLAGVVLVVAVIVLAIDWQIKNAILAESKRLRTDIEGFEGKYYGKGYPNRPRTPVNVNPPRSDVVAGDAGMEETAPDSEDTSNSWANVEHLDDHTDRGPRGVIVEVPKGD